MYSLLDVGFYYYLVGRREVVCLFFFILKKVKVKGAEIVKEEVNLGLVCFLG